MARRKSLISLLLICSVFVAMVKLEPSENDENEREFHRAVQFHRDWMNQISSIQSDAEMIIALANQLKKLFHTSAITFRKGAAIPLARDVDYLTGADVLRAGKRSIEMHNQTWAAFAGKKAETSVLRLDAKQMDAVVLRKGNSLVVVDFEDGISKWFDITPSPPEME